MHKSFDNCATRKPGAIDDNRLTIKITQSLMLNINALNHAHRRHEQQCNTHRDRRHTMRHMY